MTVSSVVPVNTYIGNSSSKKFDFDFLIESESELVVQHTDKDGVTTILKEGVDYSIKEIGKKDGSYIIFPLETSAYGVLTCDEKISLLLSLVIKQESEFRNSSYFNFNILEWTFDYIVRILQILNRKLERCVKVKEGDNISPDEIVNDIKKSEKSAKEWYLYSKEKALESQDSANLAKEWAVKTEGKIQDDDYSSKYYAQQAAGYSRQAESYSTLRYNVFCVNTGVIANRQPSFLVVENNMLKTVGCFDITTADGTIYTLEDEIKKDIGNLENGKYNVFINPVEKILSVNQCNIYCDVNSFCKLKEGDYFLNTSKVPYDFEKKLQNGFETELQEVFAGVLEIDGSDKTLYLNQYNKNIIEIERDKKNKYHLFDVIPKDHKLSFEEKEGLERLGEYVYKKSADGRYGYSDFYEKCIEEYNAEDNTTDNIYTSSNVNITGNLNDNEGVLSGFSTANYASINKNFSPGSSSWEIVLPITVPTIKGDYRIIGTNAITAKYAITLTIEQSCVLKLYISSNGTSWNVSPQGTASSKKLEFGKSYTIKISYDGEKYEVYAASNNSAFEKYIALVSDKTIYPMENLFLGIDYIFSFGDGKIDLNNAYIKISDSLYWSGVENVEMITHSNGHKFYNIKDKAKIDKIFERTGSAWYYGIDETNQRILLPRDDWYFAKLETAPVIGTGLALGLENRNNHAGLYGYTIGGNNYVQARKNAYGAAPGYYTTDNESNTGFENNIITITKEVGKSGLQTLLNQAKKEQNLYIYMVVGNTTVTQAKTKVTEVTASENDTIPLFTGMYFDFTPNHVSWLKAGTEASGKIYESTYNELLKISKGEETKYGEDFKVIKETDKLPDIDYSLYWIIDEENKTFKTPLKTACLNTISNARILIDKKEPTDEDPVWYNLYSDGWLEQGGNFNGTNANVNYAIPFKDNTYTLVMQTNAPSTPEDGAFQVYWSSKSTAGFIGWQQYGTTGATINDAVQYIACGYTTVPTAQEIAKSENIGLYFKVSNAVENIELIDCGEVLEELNSKISVKNCKAYITETYQKGTSGYRIWSDGYCEQWGYSNQISAGGNQTISFLKAYRDTSVIIELTPLCAYVSSGEANNCVDSLTATSFILHYGQNSKGNLMWISRGYLSKGSY